jgi:hypothetical protein
MTPPTAVIDSGDVLHLMTPDCSRKVSLPDGHISLSTTRKHRLPSITETKFDSQLNGTMTTQKLSVRVRASTRCCNEKGTPKAGERPALAANPSCDRVISRRTRKTLQDLPLEIQRLILDYLFGDIHPVTASSTSLLPGLKAVSSAMRHPRRKALTELSLVSPAWRDLVQERIYRHSRELSCRTPMLFRTAKLISLFLLQSKSKAIEPVSRSRAVGSWSLRISISENIFVTSKSGCLCGPTDLLSINKPALWMVLLVLPPAPSPDNSSITGNRPGQVQCCFFCFCFCCCLCYLF